MPLRRRRPPQIIGNKTVRMNAREPSLSGNPRPQQIDQVLAGTFDEAILESEEQRWVHRFWRSYLREQGRLPPRAAIDPVNFPPSTLPVLMMLDVERGEKGCRYHYRLTGTTTRQFYQKDPTGGYFEDVYSGEYLDYVYSIFNPILETRQPDFREMLLPWRNEEILHYSRAAYPFAEDGWTVDLMLLVFHPSYRYGPQSPISIAP